MPELITLLHSLQNFVSRKLYRQLSLISEALLTMQGRVTMLGISRWTGRGGSYRTLQRFFLSQIDWASLNWGLVKPLFHERSGPTLIAGDSTVVSKAGKQTFGLGRFFSSTHSKAIPSVSFQNLSLIDVERRCSYPMLTEQMAAPVKASQSDKPAQSASSPEAVKRPRGRPLGSKNKNHREVELSAHLRQVQSMLIQLQALISSTLQPAYLVYDGAFGNHAAVQMTRQTGLHLISKLRSHSALHFEWSGEYGGRGRRPLYGDRVDYKAIPDTYLKSETVDEEVRTRIYQFTAVHKKFADKLNCVVIQKYHQKTQKMAQVILFSSDLNLGWEALIDYYRLRFQIEFNFRDAKQYWGLEDFMVVKEQAVINAAQLALFMVNLSTRLMNQSGEKSVLDLKARYHALRYAKEAFKILPQNLHSISFQEWVSKIPILGRIHQTKIAT